MRQLRIVLTFYKSFIIASGIITLTCLSALHINGLKVLSAILLFKLFTLGIIILYINLYKKKEFYYYQNLGLSKPTLWIYTLATDLILFVSLITLMQWIK
ncbi:MAG: hypothetical protein B6D64_11140 [Bacteroidetes bacterium 4484_276]|nr:MAG: hypothetical protein B6D64_11140 [Bacteroidetes bacterium 4484_276]OYT14208.1 MAG: hypothetical protein B6I19_00980 [Bacteroidetes bacterium 4572_114]